MQSWRIIVTLFLILLLAACSNQPLQLKDIQPAAGVNENSSHSTHVSPSASNKQNASDQSIQAEVTDQHTQTEPDDYEYILIFPSNKYPETALHIKGAIEQGHSDVCTINRNGADDNRKRSLAGIDTMDGYDRDEWPMAMCEEGGKGASVAYIDPSDNRGAGSWVGHQLTAYEDGTKILFIVDKPENLFPSQLEQLIGDAEQLQEEYGVPLEDTKKPSLEQDHNTVIIYNNCTEARSAGVTPLYEHDPGYSKKLDRDGDGVACE